MTDFMFETATPDNDYEQSDAPKVDWDELNAYVVEAAGLQERETLSGVIKGIIDLGIQEQPDAEMVFTGSEEDEERIISEMPDTYFKDGFDYQTKKDVRLRCWPQKDVQCVTLVIEFPDVIIDKGKFFGESNPQPLRMFYGGQFYLNEQMVVGRPIPLKVVNLDKSRKSRIWSMAQNSLLYKMAVATKVIKAGDTFLPQEIGKLLGHTVQFEAQVYMKPAKNGKEYFTEYIRFVGGLARGMKPFDDVEPFLIGFNKPTEHIKEVRSHVLNTIKQATNYVGSPMQEAIEEFQGSQKTKVKESESDTKSSKPQQQVEQEDLADDDWDDDIPF